MMNVSEPTYMCMQGSAVMERCSGRQRRKQSKQPQHSWKQLPNKHEGMCVPIQSRACI